MVKRGKEKRKYVRYDTEVKLHFQVCYDIKTKIKFRLLEKDKRLSLSKQYPGISRDVNVEGLRFCSEKKLRRSDSLYIELFLPKMKKPICMTGEVRWSKDSKHPAKSKYKYDTGVRLVSVSGRPVATSIYFDKKNHILWSSVLDAIFGNFRRLMMRK